MKIQEPNLTPTQLDDEIELCKRMLEGLTYLVLAEHSKRRLAKKKLYPNFNLGESEELITKYSIIGNEYKVRLHELLKSIQ